MGSRPGHVIRLDECTLELAGRVGGKALGLGHLLRQSLEVPAGFVVTTDAYREWLARRSLGRELARLLEGPADVAADGRASRRIRDAFEATSLLDELAAEVREAYAELGGRPGGPAAVGLS